MSKADEPNNNIKKVGNDLGGPQTDAACVVCHSDFAADILDFFVLLARVCIFHKVAAKFSAFQIHYIP